MNADAAKATVLDEMIASAEGRLAEIQRNMDLEGRLLEVLRAQRRTIQTLTNVHIKNGTPSVSAANQPAVADGRSIASLVEHVMRSAPGPMKLPDIADAVSALGGRTDAKKGLISIISSILYRYKDEKYEHVGPSLYDWAERRRHQKTAGGG